MSRGWAAHFIMSTTRSENSPGTSPIASISSTAAHQPWSFSQLVAFRFIFAYAMLYVFPAPLGNVPFVGDLTTKYANGMAHLASLFGELVFGVATDPDAPFNGSGDRALDYMVVFFYFTLSLVAATTWTVIDRRRAEPQLEYRRLARGLWIYMRYVLAFTLLQYGFAKVCKSQFPDPSPLRLEQSFGESTPMGLLWTFMGYSTPYNVFTGAIECLGGLLLFWRRTTTLGALVVIGAMVNIVALNFCYDVPVKLYSSHLLVIAVLIAAPDLRRLLDVLVFKRPTTPEPAAAPLPKRWQRRARVVIKVVFIAWALYLNVDGAVELYRKRSDIPAELAPFHDAFRVEAHQVANAEVTGPTRWRELGAGRPGYLFLKREDDSQSRYGVAVDVTAKLLRFTKADARIGSEPNAYALAYSFPDADQIVLEGAFEGATVRVILKRNSRAWRLRTTGFHWVNEFPNNR